MNILRWLAPLALIAVAACASPVQVVQPLSSSLQDQVSVRDVDVTFSPLARDAITRFEDKAKEKRLAEGLPPVDPATELADRPEADVYSTLPFNHMLELVVQDVTRDWGLQAGRPIRLAVEIDTLKTANAGMAMLAGSSDQMSGSVVIHDAVNDERLGEFYVDVINSHAGLLGLAMRGGGIREKLAEEFALHVSRQLTGRKSKKA